MGRRSSIEQLPAEVRDAIARLIRDGRTIEQIRAKLAELDVDVSRSAVGRHVKSQRALIERYTAAQEVAGKLVAQIGENPQGDVGALLAEMLKTVGMQILDDQLDDSAAEGAERLAPNEFMFMAKALDHLERAGAVGYKRRKEIRADALAAAAKSVEKTGASLGLTQATIDRINEQLRLL